MKTNTQQTQNNAKSKDSKNTENATDSNADTKTQANLKDRPKRGLIFPLTISVCFVSIAVIGWWKYQGDFSRFAQEMSEKYAPISQQDVETQSLTTPAPGIADITEESINANSSQPPNNAATEAQTQTLPNPDFSESIELLAKLKDEFLTLVKDEKNAQPLYEIKNIIRITSKADIAIAAAVDPTHELDWLDQLQAALNNHNQETVTLLIKDAPRKIVSLKTWEQIDSLIQDQISVHSQTTFEGQIK